MSERSETESQYGESDFEDDDEDNTGNPRFVRNSMRMIASNPLSVDGSNALNEIKVENLSGCHLIEENEMELLLGKLKSLP